MGAAGRLRHRVPQDAARRWCPVIVIGVIVGVIFVALAIAMVRALTRHPRPRSDRPAMPRNMHNARQAARMDAAIRRAIR